MKIISNIKAWKTTILGVIICAVGLIVYYKLQEGESLFLITLGVVLVLSPDRLIDALINRIKGTK